MPKQLECRVVLTYRDAQFDMGIYDPLSDRYEPLGTHPRRDADKIVGALRERIECEGHQISFSEVNGRR